MSREAVFVEIGGKKVEICPFIPLFELPRMPYFAAIADSNNVISALRRFASSNLTKLN